MFSLGLVAEVSVGMAIASPVKLTARSVPGIMCSNLPLGSVSRFIYVVSIPKSHLCPLPFNVTTELFTVLVQRSILNEILPLTNTIAED